MATSELAGRPAPASMLVDVVALVRAYYDAEPDPDVAGQRVAFGTSGHRGSSLTTSFNEAHIIATSAAIAAYRREQGTTGPMFMGRDTHALSEPAFVTALEVLLADGIEVRIDTADGFTPTPAISHAILTWNRTHPDALADGIVVTPSHNPPADGGFKYNPPTGGPADAAVTGQIQDAANGLLRAGLDRIARTPAERTRAGATGYDFMGAYVNDLAAVIDMDAIRASDLRIGVDPLGGASVAYWAAIADHFGIGLTITNDAVDPTFGFMTVDWDGKIRMDPSSPYAMAGLVEHRRDYDLALGNDADADRFGVVTSTGGLLNPNHYLAVAASYLFGGARSWARAAAIGKTLVSSSMQDRVAASLGRQLFEVPVGFKWFVDGLLDGSVAFGGEESAGMSFLRRDGSPWSTDKDGIIACLLAAEMTAVSGHDPAQAYAALTDRFGAAGLPPHRCARDPCPEGRAGQPQARRHPGDSIGRRPHRRDADRRAWQRCRHRRGEGRDRARLVRGAPFRHRGRYQALRRIVRRRGSPRPHHRRSAGSPRWGAGRLMVDIAQRHLRTAPTIRPWLNVARGIGGSYGKRLYLYVMAAPIFEEHGYHGATVKALAHACGLSPASLYHYFGSKAEFATYPLREQPLRWDNTYVDPDLDALVQLRELLSMSVAMFPIWALAIRMHEEIEGRSDERVRGDGFRQGEAVFGRLILTAAPSMGRPAAESMARDVLTALIGSAHSGLDTDVLSAQHARMTQTLRAGLVPDHISAIRFDAAMRPSRAPAPDSGQADRAPE